MKSRLPEIILLTIFYFINPITIYCQYDTSLIGVRMRLIERDTCYKVNGGLRYSSIVTVTNNNNNDTVGFCIMEASWLVDNFEFDNDSIYIECNGWDINSSTWIHLLPHQSINFYPRIIIKNGVKNEDFKIGFLLYPSCNRLFDDHKNCFHHIKGDRPNIKRVWSRPVRISGWVNEYDISSFK